MNSRKPLIFRVCCQRRDTVSWVHPSAIVTLPSTFGLALVALITAGCQQAKDKSTEPIQSETPRNALIAKDTSPKNAAPQKDVRRPQKPEQLELYDNDTTVVELTKKTTPEQFNRICQMENLETLILDGGGVSLTQFDQLLSLRKLEHIRIRNLPAGDSEIKKLVQLKSLKIVNFPQADFTDEAIRLLSQMPDIQLLRFASGRVTDKGMDSLKHFKSLRALHLIRVPVTNGSADAFCAVQSLESLYLDGSRIDDAGFEKILKQRPDIHLHVDQIHLDYDPNKHEHDD